MANALTALRILLAVPFAFLMTRGDRWSAAPAGIVLVAAIATDLLDGVVARRRGTDTSAGGVFDHAADCLFVTAGLAAAGIHSGVSRGATRLHAGVVMSAARAVL